MPACLLSAAHMHLSIQSRAFLYRRYDIADLDRIGSEAQDAAAMHESRWWVARLN